MSLNNSVSTKIGLLSLALTVLLTAPFGAAAGGFLPAAGVESILSVCRTNPAFRAAVLQQAADWRPAPGLTLQANPAFASPLQPIPAAAAPLPAAPTAEIARQSLLVLKAYEGDIGKKELPRALGRDGARAVASLQIDPAELAAVRESPAGLEQWAAHFSRTFDDAGAETRSIGASPVAEPAAVGTPRASGLRPAEKRTRPAPAKNVPPVAGTVVFLTDFGIKDPAVAICKLVMTKINAALRIVDLTHLIPPFDVQLASNFLASALPHAPAGTVFVAVVDPGVGSARKSVAVLTNKGHLLVGPDNGLFAQAVENEGLARAVEITNPAYLYKPEVSSTFHGRDIYAPVGAHLASGVPLEELGPQATQLASLPASGSEPRLENGEIRGEVVYVEDPFGSVLTNIPKALVEQAGWSAGRGLRLEVEIGGRTLTIPYERTFSDVPLREPLALIHSRSVLSFSLNRGNFGQTYGVKEHTTVVVRRAR